MVDILTDTAAGRKSGSKVNYDHLAGKLRDPGILRPDSGLINLISLGQGPKIFPGPELAKMERRLGMIV